MGFYITTFLIGGLGCGAGALPQTLETHSSANIDVGNSEHQPMPHHAEDGSDENANATQSPAPESLSW